MRIAYALPCKPVKGVGRRHVSVSAALAPASRSRAFGLGAADDGEAPLQAHLRAAKREPRRRTAARRFTASQHATQARTTLPRAAPSAAIVEQAMWS